MKSFRQLIAEVAQPKSGDEKNFKDKHEIETIDYPGYEESQFKSSSKPKRRIADYDEGEVELSEAKQPIAYRTFAMGADRIGKRLTQLGADVKRIQDVSKEDIVGEMDAVKKEVDDLARNAKKLPMNESTQLDETMKPGYYFWDMYDGSLYPEGGHYKTFRDISKVDTGKFFKNADDDSLAIGYMDDEGFWTVNRSGKKMKKISEGLDEVSFELAKRARDKGFEKMAKSIGTTKKTKYGTNEYVPASDEEMELAKKGARQAKYASRAMARAHNKKLTGRYESLDESFKTGSLKLKDGSEVNISKKDAELLNQMMRDLNAKNRKEMQKIAMTDEAGFEEILSFAKEAL